MKTGFFVLLVLVAFRTMSAGVYYVSQSGNDANAGSQQQPWRTIGKASSSLIPGDTVFLMQGRYHEQLRPQRAGEGGKEIVYARYGLDRVIIDGIPSSLEVVIVAVDHIVLDGIDVESQAFLTVPGKVAYWVRIGGSHVTVRNCRIIAPGDPRTTYWTRRAYSRGLVTEGKYITVEHCFIRGQVMGVVIAGTAPRFVTLRYDTLYAQGASNLVIISPEDGGSQLQGNLIEHCVIDTSFEEDNIQFEPNYADRKKTYNHGTVIRGNRLGNAAENCIDFKGAALILVEGNILHGSSGDNDGPVDGPDDQGGAGFELGAGDVTAHVIARNNIFWDNHTGGKVYDGYHYYNNTFLNNRKSYRGSNSNQSGNDYSALHIWNIVANRRAIINNIFVGQPNAGVLLAQIYWGQKLALDNNLYYSESGQISLQNDQNGGYLFVQGLSEWQKVLATAPGYAYLEGKEAHSIEADPRFVHAPFYPVGFDSSWDFSQSLSSPALEAGRCATVATNSGASSTTLTVEDAYFFCDGYGAVEGDEIRIGTGDPVRISTIDYDHNTITLGAPRSWQAGAGVHTSYAGLSPNIGPSKANTLPDKTDRAVNLLSNGDFEGGLTGWSFFTNGSGTLTACPEAFEGAAAAKISISQTGDNMQLFHLGIPLLSSTRYRLAFSARSNAGQDFNVSVLKNGEGYTNYGLRSYLIDVDTAWREYSVEFVSEGFSGSVADGYLRFWFSSYAAPGDEYLLDNIVLTRLGLAGTIGSENGVPVRHVLSQNYPNPFNPETRIRFELPAEERVMLKVYDLTGAEVAVLHEGPQEAGVHEAVFDAGQLASGTYIYVLKTDSYVETRKMLLLR
jgi:hypothetical protein